MSVHIIERSAVTSGLIVKLRTLNFPVGDNNSPTDVNNIAVPFGWQGEPNATGTNFTPWLTLSPIASSDM